MDSGFQVLDSGFLISGTQIPDSNSPRFRFQIPEFRIPQAKNSCIIPQIDFWTEPSKLFQPVDIEVADEDFGTLSSLLDNNGVAFTIQIDDIQKLIEEELQPVYVRSGSWHSEYHNLEEVP